MEALTEVDEAAVLLVGICTAGSAVGDWKMPEVVQRRRGWFTRTPAVSVRPLRAEAHQLG
jgi:hypothetical protein